MWRLPALRKSQIAVETRQLSVMNQNGADRQQNGHQSENGIEGQQADEFLQKVASFTLPAGPTSGTKQRYPEVAESLHHDSACRLQVAAVLCSYVTSQSDPDEPVVRLANPAALKQRFEHAGIPLELPDGQAATSTDSLLAGVSTALRYSVRTGHPGFFNQLYARADAVSIAADWLAVAANTNVHTYEVAPVFTAVEVEVLSKLARCVGGQYATCHDGLFAPGGSISNIYGT